MVHFTSFLRQKRLAQKAKGLAPYILCLAFTAAANAQSLDGLTAVADVWVTWLRALGLVLGVGALVWGGINLYFQEMGRGIPKIVASLVGLLIAGYAQTIVNSIYTTVS